MQTIYPDRTFKAAKETFEELTWKAKEIMINKFIYQGNMINDTSAENQEIQRIHYANGRYVISLCCMCLNLRMYIERQKCGYT
jgi:hypothetical protein